MEIQQLIKDGLLIPQEDGTYKIENELRKQLLADGVMVDWFEKIVNDNTEYKLKGIQTEAEDRPADSRQRFYLAERDNLLISCNNSPWNKVYKNAQGDIETYLSMVLSTESFDLSDIRNFIERDPAKMGVPSLFFMGEPFTFYLDKRYLAALEELINKEEPPATNTKAAAGDKINWLGTQKELADLIIQLLQKGWIEKTSAAVWMRSFTKSDTLDQYLKPSEWNSKVYTSEYKPKFSEILKKDSTDNQ